MVTLPLSMASAITASQAGHTTTNLLQAASQAADLQVINKHYYRGVGQNC